MVWVYLAMIIPSLTTGLLQTLPLPHIVRRELPATSAQLAFIASSRQQIVDIIDGRDPRLLLITGPCSIHDVESALEYAERLYKLSQDVSDQFFLVMRVYFDKARSTVGWQGFAYDPHLDGSDDMASGIHFTRQLLLRLAELRVPAAAELLNPISVHYFSDLLSWGCIGARTTESQTHRQIASSLSFPVGLKNNTTGNIEAAINGVLAASSPHSFMGISSTGQLAAVRSEGNRHAHIVLRGSEDSTNYDPLSINQALMGLRQSQLPERLVIDCSHGNSRRQYERQPLVFRSVINQIEQGNMKIRALCLESHLFAGNQTIPNSRSDLKYGVSITDACLDWESTVKLIKQKVHFPKTYLFNSTL